MLIYWLSLFLLTLSSCYSPEKPKTVPPVDVTDFIVEPQTIPMVFDYVGFAESSHPVEIRARVEGYLDKIAYQEGQIVHEGALMFQIDPRQFEAKVAQAKAEVAKQNAILENAVLTVNRLKPLYEQKAASKKDLDNAIANKLSAEASLQAAQAQLLDNEINLGYTTIASPITGLTDKSKYREGALINPGANSLMTTVSVVDPIWVYFTISDNDFLRVQKELEKKQIELPQSPTGILPQQNEYIVEAILSDGSRFPYKGRVDYASPTYDQSTGTLQARAVFPNPQIDLRPGQFVRVKVYGAKRLNAIYVPQRALLQKKNGMYVYLINDNNQVIAQDVSVGAWYGDYQLVTNGLKEGDRIVVDGINKIRPGMTVNVTRKWNPPSEKQTPTLLVPSYVF